MPNVDVNLPVVLYSPVCSAEVTVAAGQTIEQFKKGLNIASYDFIKESKIILKGSDNQQIELKEHDIFDNRLAGATEICIFSKEPYFLSSPGAEGGVPLPHTTTKDSAPLPAKFCQPKKVVTQSVDNNWRSLLCSHEVDLPIVERLAQRIITCFGDFWQSVFYQLEFTTQDIDIMNRDCDKIWKHSAVRLLMRWVHKSGNRGNLRALIQALEVVHKYKLTVIDWDKLQEIIKEG
uniref:Death domain-containing protein n=1 Tax=Biomphalaria glabrata TaxID=6526 RepID=A0A2C9KXE6_BIOGL